MASLVNFLSNVFQSPGVNTTSPVVRQTQNSSPYSNNPFVNYNGNTYSNTYAKNNPVRGGYFAGYYNGKQNIVGQRLFIEV